MNSKVSLKKSQNVKEDLLKLIQTESPKDIKQQILDIEDETLRNRLVALWAVHYGFTDLFRKAIPPKPSELMLWESKSPDYKKGNPFDWENDKIVAWLDTKGKAQNWNDSNVLWLKKIKGWLSDQDPEEKVAIANKLYHFTGRDNLKAVQREWSDK